MPYEWLRAGDIDITMKTTITKQLLLVWIMPCEQRLYFRGVNWRTLRMPANTAKM